MFEDKVAPNNQNIFYDADTMQEPYQRFSMPAPQQYDEQDFGQFNLGTSINYGPEYG